MNVSGRAGRPARLPAGRRAPTARGRSCVGPAARRPPGALRPPGFGVAGAPAVRTPKQRSTRGVDWVHFFMADLETGVGPFLAIYLTSVRG